MLMKQPAEALELIIRNIATLPAEEVALPACVGRVLAGDLFSRENLPPFDNSAMDGFAVRAEDLKGARKETPRSLTIKNFSRAGNAQALALKRGHAIKIMTGAPLPLGADAIAIKEVS